MAFKDLVPWKRANTPAIARRDEPMQPFVALQDQMNRLFDNFFSGLAMPDLWKGFGEIGERMGAWNPTARWEETDNEYKLIAEVPGLTEKDVDVKLTNDTMTIQGHKEEVLEEKDKTGKGSSYRSFYESFTLPAGIDREHIQAELHAGILTLTMPKTEEVKANTRNIEVKAGS